jgi:8-oxo-dGTP diphosphatase
MEDSAGKRTPVPAVGVVCLRGGEVLLIRRGRPPRLGEWSLPGGRIEWGEGAAEAALRELREETGVEAELTGLIDVVDGVFAAENPDEPDRHYVLIDFAARWLSGEPVAGDDATEAAFQPLDRLDELVAWGETRRVIRKAADARRD